MANFPIIKIPSQIEQVWLELPPKPSFSYHPPQMPGKAPKRVYFLALAVSAFIFVVIAAILSHFVAIPLKFLLFLAGGLVITQSIIDFARYPGRKKEYRLTLENYSIKLEEFSAKKRQHERDVELANSPQRIQEFRFNKLKKILINTEPHDGNYSKAPRNPLEDIFLVVLNQYFKGNIYIKLTLIIPNFPHPYTPDFAYIDVNLNLYIDIELDEPYWRNSEGKYVASHFEGATKDNRRNQFFINKGWAVIRFSEKQIKCYPESCCKEIAKVIAKITGNDLVLQNFKHIPELPIEKQWTERESLKMAEVNERNNYQCLPLSNDNNSRARSRSANRLAAKKAKKKAEHKENLEDNSSTNPSHDTEICPYCKSKVKSKNLKSHIEKRCPKKINS